MLDELAPAEPVLDGTPGGEAAADEVALGEAAAAAQEGPPDEAAPDEALPAPSENAVPERAGAAPNVAFSLDEAPESASGEEADGAEDAHGADDASAETRDASAQTRADEAAQPLAGAPDAQPLGGAPDVQPSAAAPDSQPEVPPGEAPSFDAALADAVLPEAVPEEGEPEQQSPEPLALIGEAELRGALEAILLVVEEPVSEVTLAQALEQPVERVTGLLGALAKEYESTGRGFELRQAAGGWRLYTRPEYAQYVERFVLDGQQLRLTQAALETLAVVAYKQPVTRSRISAIRGVNCDGVIRTLISRGLVEECGTEPDSGAFLYRTTNLFLEKLGLNSVDELPPLAPFLPDDVDEITDAPS